MWDKLSLPFGFWQFIKVSCACQIIAGKIFEPDSGTGLAINFIPEGNRNPSGMINLLMNYSPITTWMLTLFENNNWQVNRDLFDFNLNLLRELVDAVASRDGYCLRAG